MIRAQEYIDSLKAALVSAANLDAKKEHEKATMVLQTVLDNKEEFVSGDTTANYKAAIDMVQVCHREMKRQKRLADLLIIEKTKKKFYEQKDKH